MQNHAGNLSKNLNAVGYKKQKTKLTQKGVIKVSFDESDVCVEHHKIKCEMIKCTEKSLVVVMSAV